MYFHKPQEKPRKWGSFQDVQYAVMKNCEKIYNVDPDSLVLTMPLFWGLPPMDFSGYNNHGTNHGASYKDERLNFVGTDTPIVMADADIFTFGTSPFSIIASIYPTDSSTNNPILAKYYAAEPFDGEWDFTSQSTDVLRLQCLTDGTSNRIKITGSQSIPLNAMSLVAATYSGGVSETSLNLYVNGTLDPSPTKVDDGGYTGMVNRSASVQIGAKLQGSTYDSYFYGGIFSVLLSSALYTADQIALFHDLPWALYQPVSRPIYFFQAAEGISIPVAMQNMRGGFNPIGMRGGFINAD